MNTCTSCGAQNEPGAAFCDQCGTKLAAAPSSPALGAAPVQPPVQLAYTSAAMPPAMPQAVAQPAAAPGTICPSCGGIVTPFEAFCEHCGAKLPVPQPSVAPPASPYTPAQQYGPAQVYVPSTPQPGAVPVAAASLVAANGVAYALSGKPIYVVGREDVSSGIFPEVDTTNSGGEEAGVSRKHVVIHFQAGQWVLEALQTPNKSFVNGQYVAPGQTRALQPGDQIQLGRWSGVFRI